MAHRTNGEMARLIRGTRRFAKTHGYGAGILQDRNVLMLVAGSDATWVELGTRARDALRAERRVA